MTTRIAILISGRGSNMAALADAVQNGTIPNAEISLVLSDQLHAQGVKTSQKRGIRTYVILRGGRTREEHERDIVSILRDERIDLICLAGYMRVLSPFFADAFKGRILNIHPSLLPAFPGLDAQRQALENGAIVSGCTVHFVDNTLDGGPIIAQRTVPVLPGDTVESLSARILEQEHILYPEAVASVISSLDRESNG